MEKVFKILIVFVLLMFLIVYSIRAREGKFREYAFSHRIPIHLPLQMNRKASPLVISHQGQPPSPTLLQGCCTITLQMAPSPSSGKDP